MGSSRLACSWGHRSQHKLAGSLKPQPPTKNVDLSCRQGLEPLEPSSRTSTSAAATRARARAEAAKIKVSYAEKEAAMMKEKASIEANLHVLRQEMEATAASKEAAVYEEAAAGEHLTNDSLGEFQDLTLEDPIKRTRDYINTQSFDQHTQQELQDAMSLQPVLHGKVLKPPPLIDSAVDTVYKSCGKDDQKPIEGERYVAPSATKVCFLKQEYLPVAQSTPDQVQYNKYLPAAQHTPVQTQYSQHLPAAQHTPVQAQYSQHLPAAQRNPVQTQYNKYSPAPQTPDLAQYLIRREMVSSGLLAFDDRPENYWAWKSSFLSATKDLNSV